MEEYFHEPESQTVNCLYYKIVTLILTILEFLPHEVIFQAPTYNSCQDFAAALPLCAITRFKTYVDISIIFFPSFMSSVSVPISTRLVEFILFLGPTSAKPQCPYQDEAVLNAYQERIQSFHVLDVISNHSVASALRDLSAFEKLAHSGHVIPSICRAV